MPQDSFRNVTDSVIAPAEDCFAILPDDLNELPQVTKALYVGVAGDLTLSCLRSDADVTFLNVPAGSILDLRVKAVRSSGTSAAGIVGLA